MRFVFNAPFRLRDSRPVRLPFLPDFALGQSEMNAILRDLPGTTFPPRKRPSRGQSAKGDLSPDQRLDRLDHLHTGEAAVEALVFVGEAKVVET